MGFIFILNPRKEIGISIFSLAISSLVNAAIYYFMEMLLEEVADHVESFESKLHNLERTLKENKLITNDNLNSIKNKYPDNLNQVRASISRSDVSRKTWECSCGFRNSMNDDFCMSCFKKKR